MNVAKLLKFFVFLILISAANTNAGVICLNPGIAGFEPAAIRAKSLLTPPTKNVENAKLYIEKDSEGDFYFHSNYISRASDNPTKIAGFSELKDVDVALQNIVFPGIEPSKSDLLDFQVNYRDVEIILDQSVFDGKGNTALKFDGFENIRYSRRDDPPPTVTLLYNRGTEKNKLLKRTEKCCVFSEVTTPQKEIMKRLQMKKYQPKDTKLLSLIIDSSTEKTIKSSNLNEVKVDLNDKALANIEKQLEKMKGKTLIVLGHVEKGKYVINNSMGKEVVSVKIGDLRSLANKHNVQLIDVGCNTASLPSSQFNSIGVAARFNSVQAAELLIKAHNSSKNYAEFLHNISSNDMPVVIDSKIYEHTDIRANILSKPRWGSIVQKSVGTIALTLGSSITKTSMLNSGNQVVDLVDPNQQDQKSALQRALERMVRGE